MLFQAAITIPKNTTEVSPKTQLLGISKGIITKFMVRPRQGHAALAHLTIRYHEHQIAPSTEEMDLHGDSFPIDWEDFYECYEPPFELKLTGWNEDDTYPHTFDVFVAILPRRAIPALALLDAIKNLFTSFLPKRIFGGLS